MQKDGFFIVITKDNATPISKSYSGMCAKNCTFDTNPSVLLRREWR